jgi:hypothetical protein
MLSRPGGADEARRRKELSPERKELIHRYMTERSVAGEPNSPTEETRPQTTPPAFSTEKTPVEPATSEEPSEPELPAAMKRLPARRTKAVAAETAPVEESRPRKRPTTRRRVEKPRTATAAEPAVAARETGSDGAPEPAAMPSAAAVALDVARSAPRPTGARPAFPPGVRLADRWLTDIAYLRAEQPDVIWYAVTAAIAILIGIAIPLLLS